MSPIRSRFKSRKIGAAMLVAGMVFTMLGGLGSIALGASVTGVPYEDNKSCADFGLLQVTKFEFPPSNVSADDDLSKDGVTIHIDSADQGQPIQFDWTSTTPIDAVLVRLEMVVSDTPTMKRRRTLTCLVPKAKA